MHRRDFLPDGPEWVALLYEAFCLLAVYMPRVMHKHQVALDLAQPWLIGYRRHPFTTRKWAWIDVDAGLKVARA